MDRDDREKIDESVLSSFEEGEYRMPDEAAGVLSLPLDEVTRSIGRLEDAGYQWERHPRLGLRLTGRPDRLMHSEVVPHLTTRWLGRKIRFFRSLKSTNDTLSEREFAGASAGTVIVAEEQIRGRGRLDRTWEAPPFRALLFSVLLGADADFNHASRLTLTSGIAVAEAIRMSGGPELRIRWPNDLVSGEKKVCGILCEFRPDSSSLVLGIGLNVNQLKDELPSVGTSLCMLSGKTFRRGALLASILNRLEVWIEHLAEGGFEPIRVETERLSALPGKTVTLDMGGSIVRGIAAGIGPQGGIVLRTAEGEKEYRIGEVTRVSEVGGI